MMLWIRQWVGRLSTPYLLRGYTAGYMAASGLSPDSKLIATSAQLWLRNSSTTH
jgi:hypothetical protein